MYKRLFIALAVTASLSAISAELPSGFACKGTTLDPQCGKITIPKGWKELKPKTDEKLPGLSKEARKSGYIIFKKHYMQKVSPYTIPKNYEETNSLKLFASPGEYEPAAICIYALRSISGFKVKVSDLFNRKGEKLDASNIEVRSAVNLPFKVANLSKTYTLQPEILEKKSARNLPANQTTLYWLTVYVPQNCPAGTYKGQITLSGMNTPERKVGLLLKVFPVKLLDPPIEIGMYMGGHQKDYALRQKFYADMKANGMNTMAPCNFSVFPSWKNGKIVLDFRTLDREMKLYREAGFSKPVQIDMRPIEAWLSYLQNAMDNCKRKGVKFPDNYSVRVKTFDVSPKYTKFEAEEYKKIVRKLVVHARQKKYPPLYFLPQEESTNKGTRMQQLERYSKLLKECGVKVTAWSNGPWGGNDELQPLDKYIDVRYYNFVTPKIANRTKKSGDFFGIYNHGGRLMFGFFGRKVKAQGIFQWAYIFANTKGLYSGGKLYYGDSKVYLGIDGPLPSPGWEEIREGIDDMRYIYTLESLIADQIKSKDKQIKAQAESAKDVLENILSQIPDNTRDLYKKNQLLDPASFDLWRYKIIRQIMKLQKNAEISKVTKNVNKNSSKSFILNICDVPGTYSNSPEDNKPAKSLVIPLKNNIKHDLTSAIWSKAASTGKFVMTYEQAWKKAQAFAAGAIGKIAETPAREQSVAYLCYDSSNLYIGIRCLESKMSQIVANTTKRDGAVWSDDSVEIFIIPTADHQKYYQIAVNSKGTICDKAWSISNGKRHDAGIWNPLIKASYVKTKEYWSVILQIPFSAFGLKGAPAPGSCWKLNIGREQQRLSEYSTWNQVARSFHERHNFGSIYFQMKPEVIISKLDSSQVYRGENVLPLVVEKTVNKVFSGKVKIIVNSDNDKATFAHPVIFNSKKLNCNLKYLVKNFGTNEITVEVLKQGSISPLYQTSFKTIVPDILKFKLLQNEITAGSGSMQSFLKINISDIELAKTRLTATLQGPEVNIVQDMGKLTAGDKNITFNTSGLKMGVYTIKIQAFLNAKNIATTIQTFNIIENIY